MRTFLIPSLLVALVLTGCNRTDETVSESRPEPAARQNAALGFRIDFKESILGGKVAALNQAALTVDGEKLLIKASGNDPSVSLPALTVQPGAQFALRIEQDTPADTTAEVFYTTAATPGYTSENEVSVPVKAGRSVILFEINDPGFAGGLRYDPGQVPGDYTIHQMEAFASEPLRPGVTPPSPTPGASPAASTSSSATP